MSQSQAPDDAPAALQEARAVEDLPPEPLQELLPSGGDAPAGVSATGASVTGASLTAGAPASLAALAELITVVDRLRDPEGGCPWDLEQTHASLVPYVLEEAHEVADAIRHGDDRHLAEELGDLLLQVVLHARIASEAGRFDLETIAAGITGKLIRRHPHVFAGAEAADSAAVRRSWEAIKEAERAEKASRVAGGELVSGLHGTEPAAVPSSGVTPLAEAPLGETGGAAPPAGGPGGPAASVPAAAASGSPLSDRLAGKVRGQPALAGAMTISRRAAAAGFEWDDMDGVWQKVHEELDELKEAVHEALTSGDRAHAQEELGDVLFTLVNVARWCGIDPEAGLAGTNRRFLDRFSRVEAALGGDLQGRSIRELEGLWQQAKAEIRAAEARASLAEDGPPG